MSGDFKPKFVKHFANIGDEMIAAFKEYKNEVAEGTFPAPENSFVKSDCSDEFLEKLDAEY